MNDQTLPTRNLIFFLGGMTLLGVLLALLLFGGQLWGEAPAGADTAAEFALQTPVINQIPVDNMGAIQVGNPAPQFGLADLEGAAVRLQDYAGQPVILNFWATWCAPCRQEMPELQALYEEKAADGLVILALNREETPDQIRQFFYEEMGLTFTPLLDETGAVANSYGVFNMPTTYFVAGDGTVAAVHRGPLTQEQLVDYYALMTQ